MLIVEFRLSSWVQSRARLVRAEMEGTMEQWMEKLVKWGLKMFCLWTDMNNLTRAEGECSGKGIWTGRVKPSSGGSQGGQLRIDLSVWNHWGIIEKKKFFIGQRRESLVYNFPQAPQSINKWDIQIINKK